MVDLVKGEASLGVGIMGGSDRPTHVFRQGDKPGIFIREVGSHDDTSSEKLLFV